MAISEHYKMVPVQLVLTLLVYVGSILHKLELNNRTQAALYAIEAGLIISEA